MPQIDDRVRLKSLRDALLRLHKILLDSERAAYEHDVERITTVGQFFNLVTSDPWFAWLRDISQFIVFIDEQLDLDPPADTADAGRLIARARELLLPAENGQGFGRKYYEAMQRDPGVVVAHGDMMKVFSEISD
jgi:hypothetical protein